jgi:hypothetical protein
MVEQTGEIASAFLRRGRLVEDIIVGSRYQQQLPDGTSEIAIVAALFFDLRGIPHVGFNLLLVRPGDPIYRADRRALGLKAFCARYVEPALGWRSGGARYGIVEKPFGRAPANGQEQQSLRSTG